MNFFYYCAFFVYSQKKKVNRSSTFCCCFFISLTPFMCSELLRDISAEHEEYRNEYGYCGY